MPAPDLPTPQIVESVEATWGAALLPAGCAKCHQTFLVLSSRLGQTCPNCASDKLSSQPVLLRKEPPELIIPFRSTKDKLLPSLTQFVREVWLRPDDFNPQELLRRATPMFWPMWLVDSDVRGDWQAEAGFDYQVKSSQETYSDSGWRSHERVETRIRWEPRLGQLTRHYDNIAGKALSNHQELLNMIGDYRLDQAMSFKPAELNTSDVHLPDLQPESAWPSAQSNLNRMAADECQRAAGAQHIRNFIIHADYDALHWTQLLLPMYASYYTDDAGQHHSIYINGQSGKIGGVRLASQRKGWRWAGISAAIATALFLLGLLFFAAGSALPTLSAIALLLIFLAFCAGVFAIIPAVWPWQWNRKQQEHKITHG